MTTKTGVFIPKIEKIEIDRPRLLMPLEEMEVGDSIFVPNEIRAHSTVASKICRWNQKNAPKKFSTRVKGEGTVVWRVM